MQADQTLPFTYDDGGRAGAGYKGETRDCVTRSIAIATQLPYPQVYSRLNEIAANERTGKRKRTRSSARTGVHRYTYDRFLREQGWIWVPTMRVGEGCTVHLRRGELPHGRLIVKLSRHLTALIYEVIHDTHDCSRSGSRCVYGYWYSDEHIIQ